ncbi:MAG: 2-oxoglutarate dehydrogenase complex dihydrolipoyllysine-residue succinyltransferase [Bacteroidales bacterium]|nr:2-oxoglutarate dehydrogenase complex dihydrolipoyllysine-residue succinyltransferase [Bacteroidales bacterium]
MITELKIPSPGESVTEVEIAAWLVKDGDYVEKDQELAELESDKATLALVAPEAGRIKILVQEGETVKVATVAGTIDSSATKPPVLKQERDAGKKKVTEVPEKSREKNKQTLLQDSQKEGSAKKSVISGSSVKITPLAKKMMEENGLSADDIINGLKKITTKEVNLVLSAGKDRTVKQSKPLTREMQRSKISQLRKKLSQRLVAVKNETAMLTTFNEVDMSAVIALRKKYQKQFQEKFGVKPGFMSFFAKAVTQALNLFPAVNSMIEGEDIVTPGFVDICIAVQTDKGLMVPVIRNTESLTLPEIELKIAEMAEKARSFKITVDEMTGGTFTITNGGVFGSMLSTPLINPPQSAILGMHNIVERPVAVDGRIEIRPMMYLALSYDHRIIDGRDSVSFLVKVKEFIESPLKMMADGRDLELVLLGLG